MAESENIQFDPREHNLSKDHCLLVATSAHCEDRESIRETEDSAGRQQEVREVPGD